MKFMLSCLYLTLKLTLVDAQDEEGTAELEQNISTLMTENKQKTDIYLKAYLYIYIGMLEESFSTKAPPVVRRTLGASST